MVPVSRRDGVRQDICMWLDEKAQLLLMACQDWHEVKIGNEVKPSHLRGNCGGQVWPHLNEEERKKVKTWGNSRCFFFDPEWNDFVVGVFGSKKLA